MLYCVNMYRALACLIILNFHMESLYLDSLSILSFGSDLGNNMFFLVSGFTLFQSIERADYSLNSFLRWTWKRWMRILPMVLFMEVLTLFVSGMNLSGGYLFNVFVFPTAFWFTGAIMIYYPLLFIVEKIDKRTAKILIALILLVLHLIRDDIFAERYFIGFIAMMTGTEIRKNVNRESHDDIIKIVIGTGLSAFFVVILKLARSRSYEKFGIMHLLTEIAVVLLATFLFILLYRNEKKLETLCVKNVFLGKVFAFLSNITLAAYMIQLFDDSIIIRYMRILPFPVSVVICTLVICGLAGVLTGVDKKVRRLLVKV